MHVGLKCGWNEFVGVFRNPFAIDYKGVKQLKNNVVSLLGYQAL